MIRPHESKRHCRLHQSCCTVVFRNELDVVFRTPKLSASTLLSAFIKSPCLAAQQQASDDRKHSQPSKSGIDDSRPTAVHALGFSVQRGLRLDRRVRSYTDLSSEIRYSLAQPSVTAKYKVPLVARRSTVRCIRNVCMQSSME